MLESSPQFPRCNSENPERWGGGERERKGDREREREEEGEREREIKTKMAATTAESL